ncbi:hypothetical protein GCM10012289_57970 [Nonomuraea cavernae]|uniref:Uncharacterized protein n=1 Tax=Nonomuraea cavernae TaxID=2045107 RepID=A0A917Z9G8_9ACTN|nr:hypothetical protein GCM10012289_57970 [Nonomuraea cavernae]
MGEPPGGADGRWCAGAPPDRRPPSCRGGSGRPSPGERMARVRSSSDTSLFFPSVAIDATSIHRPVKTRHQGFPTEKYAQLALGHSGNIDAFPVVTFVDDF